ncbi:hypothetical protein HUU39_04380 [candidate division KSB1 bacterium]|nr:hypothetical protein [bacterium]NUM64501.1 hypothetical protein [candidate division KSB1 bacterium]
MNETARKGARNQAQQTMPDFRQAEIQSPASSIEPDEWPVALICIATMNVIRQGSCEDLSTAPSTSQDSF